MQEDWRSMIQGDGHSFALGVGALWIFSAAVSAMGAPNEKSSPGYQWLFRFSHLLAANLDRAGLLGDGELGPGASSAAK